MQLRGVYTALITPFKSGEVDLDTFRAHCDRQLAAGVHGLVPCGTTGETPTLSHGEWSGCIRTAVAAAAGSVPVIAGCGSNSTAKTVAAIEEAIALGADAALVVFPYYNKPNPAGLAAHVQAACAPGLPVVLYHVPGRTGQRLPASQLESLCRTPGVVALKEATGDVALGIEVIQRLADTNVSILSGDDFTFAPLTAMGGHGVISVVSNPAPAQTVAWYEAANSGDIATLRGLSDRLMPLVRYLFSSSNPVPVKAAMAAMGLCDNELRLPLAPGEAPPPALIAGLS
jgi:4-hydroxy-tetrahydrodipicolinate synthase